MASSTFFSLADVDGPGTSASSACSSSSSARALEESHIYEREVILQYRLRCLGAEGLGLFSATGEELITEELDQIHDEEEAMLLIPTLVVKYRSMGFIITDD